MAVVIYVRGRSELVPVQKATEVRVIVGGDEYDGFQHIRCYAHGDEVARFRLEDIQGWQIVDE